MVLRIFSTMACEQRVSTRQRGCEVVGSTHDLLLLGLVGETGAAEVAAGLLEAVEVLFDPLDVLEAELGLDDVHVAEGVDVALDVDDLGVVEGADDLEDAVDGADVGEEGVTEAGAGGRALWGMSQCNGRRGRSG
jgi:hypothetical protein